MTFSICHTTARPDGWRFYALDVATLQERATAATTFVDDQAEWLDNEHVLYTLPHLGSGDVYVARTDGSERSRLFMHDAQSPIVIRPAAAAEVGSEK